jgi:hypothetical protein
LWRGRSRFDGGCFFITHPDVVIDPGVPVPDWPLNARGLARMPCDDSAALGQRGAPDFRQRRAQRPRCSANSRGRAWARRLPRHRRPRRKRPIGDGFPCQREFEVTVGAFFAKPLQSIRGWEPAADAQARIVGAVEQAMSQTLEHVNIAIVVHGGTGTLLYCHLAGLPTHWGFLGFTKFAAHKCQGKAVQGQAGTVQKPARVYQDWTSNEIDDCFSAWRFTIKRRAVSIKSNSSLL